MVWCFVRLFIPTPSGRKRVNVLGALNAITHELITVVNETYINSESVCELLWHLAQTNFTVPVTLGAGQCALSTLPAGARLRGLSEH